MQARDKSAGRKAKCARKYGVVALLSKELPGVQQFAVISTKEPYAIGQNHEITFSGRCKVSGIVERRHTMPILANILIRKDGADVSFLSTDIEVQITTHADVGSGGEVGRAPRWRRASCSTSCARCRTATRSRCRCRTSA